MNYSAIVLSFNSEKYIEKCLQCLVDSFRLLDASFEIFVIDNGSIDRSKELVKVFLSRNKCNLYLIELDENTGTTYSRNLGLSKSTGEHILVLDSDAYVNPEAIQVSTGHLRGFPHCGLVCPRLVYPDGRFQMSTDNFPTFFRKAQRFFFLKKIEGKVESQPGNLQVVDYAISAFWMIPRPVLQRVGLLDEHIFYSPEDVDYCIRIWKAGFFILYDPSVEVVHDAQEISRSKGFKINAFTFMHIKGLFYLFLKHRYFFSGRKFSARKKLFLNEVKSSAV